MIAKKIATAIPLSAYRWLYPDIPLSLCYHAVSNISLPHLRNIMPCKSAEMFEKDLIFLKKNFDLVSYAELRNIILSPLKNRSKYLCLSFDDGYAECFSVIKPILLKHKVPSIFFITTDFIDNKCVFYRNKISICIDHLKSLTYVEKESILNNIAATHDCSARDPETMINWVRSLEWSRIKTIDRLCDILNIDTRNWVSENKPYLTGSQIRQLYEDGFTIGGHGRSHLPFKLLDIKGMEDEIVGSCRVIMALTGEKEVPFAFPFFADVTEDFLEKLFSQYPFLKLFFNMGDPIDSTGLMINRLCCDDVSEKCWNSSIEAIIKVSYGKELKNILYGRPSRRSLASKH